MSPFLYSLFTHGCRPVDGSNTIIKFSDDTMVISLIKDNEEADLDDGLLQAGEEGSPEPLLPEDSEEEPPVLRHPGELPLHHREHPDQLHHSVVRELPCLGP